MKAELAELRAKVRELSADLKDEQRQRTSAVDLSDLVQGDETAHIGCVLEFHWLSTIDAGEAYPSKRAHGQWAITPTWNRVFRHLGPELMDEASEEYLMERLSALCLEVSRDDLLEKERSDSKADGTDSPGDNKNSQEGQDSGSDDDDDDQVGQIYEATVTIESFNDVKVQFAALGLIERGTKRRPGSDTRTYWRLTERGNNQLLRLRAIRRPTLVNPEPGADGG